MSDLPSGWEWATLGEIASSVRNGIFVSRPGADPDGVPILRISSVRSMQLNLDDIRYSGKNLDELQEQDALLLPGDLVFTRYSGSREYVGVCARVPESVGSLTYPDKLIRARVPIVDCKYLAAAFASPVVRLSVERVLRTTAGQVGISGSALKETRIPIAPLAEQRRIVAALEDHLSRLDSAARTLTSTRPRICHLIASQLYGQTHQSSRDLRSLSEVAEARLGRQRSPKNHHGDSMRPYLRAANVGWKGLELDDVKEMNFTADEAKIYELRPGDIVLNEASGTPLEVGKPAIWSGEIEGCCLQNTLIRVRPFGISPRFLLHYLRADAMCGKFAAHTRGVNIRHLGAAAAASWPVWVPSPRQQSEIVAQVEAAESCIEHTSAAIAIALERERRLRRSLLAEAFAGRLVPQDPNDEPASVLLERIRAQRAAQPMPKRTRRAKKTTQETGV